MPERLPNSIYSPHPGFAMETASRRLILERTGRTVEEWVKIVEATGPPGAGDRRDWLKAEHGFTTNYALWVVELASGKGGAANYRPDEMVDAQFSGLKFPLRPIYDRLVAIAFELGDDVRACPCATIVPLYRNHVFAQLRAPNRSRIDLGLALRDTPAVGRLIDTGGYAKKDRITHRIPIAALNDIDDEAILWLRRAYKLDE